MTSMSVRPLLSVKAKDSRQAASTRAVMSPWTWMAVTCLLLGISGGVRFWREWKFSALAAQKGVSPFPLSQIPWAMGIWQAREGSEAKLDPQIARLAGASDHIMRDYDDPKAGEKASVLVLYGLGANVAFHTPDVCYLATGHRLIKGPIDRTITVPGVEAPIHYRWAIYAKQVGGISHYVESLYTFHHKGDWVPEAADRWKMFRYDPGVYKIQISRDVSTWSENGEGPCDSLLAEIVRQINDRSSPSGPGKDRTSAKTTSAATR
jgi:Protein of unknown function (DUF3485)